jgi:four helix bundle protein
MDSKVAKKAFAFAVRTVKMNRYLRSIGCDRALCSQLLHSGTSIGANIEEALCGQSKKDFIAKLSIAQKECRETMYWLRLLYEGTELDERFFQSIYPEAEELYKMVSSIIISSKHNA